MCKPTYKMSGKTPSLLILFLLAYSIQGCIFNKSTYRSQPLLKELDRTSWVLYSLNDSTRIDTMTFTFGYDNLTGEIFNVLEYNDGHTKEISLFSTSKNTITFISYWAAPPSVVFSSDSCRGESKLLYSNNGLSYIFFDRYCNDVKKRITPDSLNIKFRRLETVVDN
jgi:hypothetical protein